MQSGIPMISALLLVSTACATHGPVVSQPGIAVRNSQFQCALNSATNQGFVVTRNPRLPDQFEARRDNTPQPDILLVGVHVSNDSARVGAVPVSNDDRVPASRNARDATRQLTADCPPRPVG